MLPVSLRLLGCLAKQDYEELISPMVPVISQLLNIWLLLETTDRQIRNIRISMSITYFMQSIPFYCGLGIVCLLWFFILGFFFCICWEGNKESNFQWKSNTLLKPDTNTNSSKLSQNTRNIPLVLRALEVPSVLDFLCSLSCLHHPNKIIIKIKILY